MLHYVCCRGPSQTVSGRGELVSWTTIQLSCADAEPYPTTPAYRWARLPRSLSFLCYILRVYLETGSTGLRPRIEPSQVPSPIEAAETDRQTWENKIYLTLPGAQTPLPTSEFVAVDQGKVV
jgi:hypothetical protein